jgi:hypothetical protein
MSQSTPLHCRIQGSGGTLECTPEGIVACSDIGDRTSAMEGNLSRLAQTFLQARQEVGKLQSFWPPGRGKLLVTYGPAMKLDFPGIDTGDEPMEMVVISIRDQNHYKQVLFTIDFEDFEVLERWCEQVLLFDQTPSLSTIRVQILTATRETRDTDGRVELTDVIDRVPSDAATIFGEIEALCKLKLMHPDRARSGGFFLTPNGERALREHVDSGGDDDLAGAR